MQAQRLIVFTMLEDGDILQIKLPAGPFEASNLRDFKEKVTEVWSEQIKQVRFDFSEVTFIGSPAIGAILSVYRRLPRDAKPVHIQNPNSAIRSTMHIFRLDEVFDLR